MFARWLNVRLRAAEKALRQGRIDEVYTAVREPELRNCARGRRLVDGLAKPLAARARLHRQAGRYREALADLDKLEALGRGGPDVQTLRQLIHQEWQAGVDRDVERQAAVGETEERLKAGRLDTVRLDVGRIEDARQRERLADELEQRVQRSSQLLEQANEALARDDVLAAARFWQEAVRRHGRTRDTDEFTGRLSERMQSTVAEWVAAGRIGNLMAARDALAALVVVEPELEGCQRMVGLCARATAQLAERDFGGLRETLLRLKAACAEAKWIEGALVALDQVKTGQERLMASPLGLFASAAPSEARQAPQAMDAQAEVVAERAPVDPHAARLDGPLLMLVDGGGSNLLVGGERVRIGRAEGAGRDVEVAVPGDVHRHHADIVRRGEDYFLTAYAPVQVNRKRVEHALLRHGDRIALGSRVRMVFERPSSKSTSAVLRLSHRCHLAEDVGTVVLFHDTCLIGPGTTCHVQTREGDGRLVVFVRNGVLHARQTAGRNWMGAPAEALVLDRAQDVGDVRVTVKRVGGRGRLAQG